MSAAALRAPATTEAVARHYLRLLASHRTAGTFALTGLLGLAGSVNSRGFEGLAGVLWLVGFLPLLHWGAADRRGEWDDAMPVDRVRHDLVRTACGALWAAAAVALPVVMVALLLRVGYRGHLRAAFWWYPLLLVAAGVANYLVGAAAWLRFRNVAALFCAVYGVGLLPFLLLARYAPRVQALLSLREAPAAGELAAGVAWTALYVGAAALAACAAAAAPRWHSRLGSWRGGWAAWTWRRRTRRASRRTAAGARRRPPPAYAVLWREVVLQRQLLAAGFVFFALMVSLQSGDTASERGRPSAVEFAVYFLPLWWPMVVWRMSTSPRLRRVQPIPVAGVAQQLARLAVGAGWLVATLLVMLGLDAATHAPGAASYTPAQWPSLLAGALLLYLLASLPALVAKEHRFVWNLGWLVFLLMMALPFTRLRVPPGRFSLSTALSMFTLHPQDAWVNAVLLWTGIFAAFAVGAAALGVKAERGELLA